jgi:signal transduction histidine kinase
MGTMVPVVDSDVSELEARVAAVRTAPQDAQARVDALVDLAWAIRFSERERSKQLATEARELSISIGDKRGQAWAARTLCMTTFTPDTVQVRIQDTGRGMSEEKRVHLFDVGWSADRSRTKIRLGLAAAHATVQRHDGRVAVQSAPGKGTTFVFNFPAHQGPDSTPPEG